MPNWTANALTLKHADPAMIDRAQHCESLLMEFLPTPEALRNTSAGFHCDPGLDTQHSRNLELYGAKDWYDWNCQNWGTKWDFSFDTVEREDEYTLTASFDTAWSPPIEAYEKLEALGFEITAKFYEPGMCFVGTYVTGEGEVSYTIPSNAEDVRDEIGEELDDYFGISEEMAQYDDEEDS